MENYVSTTICVPLSGSNHTAYLITMNAVNAIGSGVNTSGTCKPPKTRLTVYYNLPTSKRYAIALHARRGHNNVFFACIAAQMLICLSSFAGYND